MQGSTTPDLLFALKLNGRHVLGVLVLVHLVLPRCEVVSVEFLNRKSASHLSIHVELLLLLYDRNFAGCCYNNLPVLRERGLRHYTGGGDGVGSSYQAL